ncbi:RsmE family RNA methyltransferase [Elusimicrobiota bacterium]
MTKIFVDNPLRKGSIIKITGDNYHHLDVVKKNIGDVISVGDSLGKGFNALIKNKGNKEYLIEITNEVNDVPSPMRDVSLYVSLPKKKKFEDIVFKCTQIGISEFIPMVSPQNSSPL